MPRPIRTSLVALAIIGSVHGAWGDVGVRAAEPLPADESASPPTADAAYVTDHVVVRWRDEARAGTVTAARGLGRGEELAVPGTPELVETNGRPVDQVLAELRADPAVVYAEPDYIVHLAAPIAAEQPITEPAVAAVSVNDPLTSGQYALDRMRVRDAWSLTTGANNVIAVLDTGVKYDHPDLAGRLLPGHDFVNNDGDATDDNGHGTWVAGIIAANANNGLGGAGISWSDRVLPVKIMNATGTGTASHLTAGIVWAADQGAKVINMSVGGFPASSYTVDAVNYAWNHGAVLVGAAGNTAREEVFYPGAYGNVISVTGTQPEDEFASWSSYGSAIDLSAPGASVFTTNCVECKPAEGGPYTYISGTSFAVPNVAGVAALIWARFPGWTNSQVVAQLYASVDDLGYGGWDNRYGLGRVNAYRAVGGSPGALPAQVGDSLEGNNSQGAATHLGLGTIHPNIYPAGDVDWFALDAPRAGRLDFRATGMSDARAWPWTRSALPVDPAIDVYDANGIHIRHADAVGSTGTEVAAIQVGGATRLWARVSNAYPNGNRTAYTLTTAFVDNVAPVVAAVTPATGATNVSRFVTSVATFNEPVTNATAATAGLRDMVTGASVPATVTVSGAQVRVRPVSQLVAQRRYFVELGSGIHDLAGNNLVATGWEFTTGLYGYADTDASIFGVEIGWLTESGITAGCAADRYCPLDPVTRAQMASFLVRALHLPPAPADLFTDDSGSIHESDINSLAAAGITGGCAPGRFCPSAVVTRDQMASFLARALALPPASGDAFSDDEGSIHEADINRLAASGIASGCGGGRFCPSGVVNREQMAAFLYRAFAP